jgi:CrcB protein
LRPSGPEHLAAVALGGVLGSLGRWGVGLALPHSAGHWPWSTLLVNLSGCLLMGLLVARLAFGGRPHVLFRPFLGVGVLGGWTTFSAFSVDLLELANAGRPLLAAAYVAGSVVVGVVAVGSGHAVGQRIWAREGAE